MYLMFDRAYYVKVAATLKSNSWLKDNTTFSDGMIWRNNTQPVCCIQKITNDTFMVIVPPEFELAEKEVADAVKEFALPTVIDIDLFHLDAGSAMRIIRERSGLIYQFDPIFFLHNGRILIQLHDDGVSIYGHGEPDVIKHAVSVAALLQKAVKV